MRLTNKVLHTALNYDVAVVGGGIVGCATARQLKLDRPNLKIALLEKEDQLSKHQSGNNSGVLHAGIYYQPGSLKAKLCVQGIDLAYDYIEKKNIPHKRCGKLIVAVDNSEIANLDKLYERAQQNGCKDISMVGPDKIKEIQPACRGVKALWSPYTGIVDWKVVTLSYADDFVEAGGSVYTPFPLTDIKESGDPKYPIRIESGRDEKTIHASQVITCAGLQSDRVAQLTGCKAVPKIVPFRGEYLYLKPEKHHLVTTNIYPVPDPRFPFLGVHFTPTMRGEVLLGPNAVLAFKREGYSYFDFSLRDFIDAVSFAGMQRLMVKYAGFGMGEMYRGIFYNAQVKKLQRYIPEISHSDVTRGRAGVRAQALDATGALVDDFVFDDGVGPLAPRLLHIRNAPSPGATSSMAIAKMVVDKAVEKFSL
ncbi:unnamed protein product [Bursaphelenchus okinawaensis]|uniref:L-2-hydroxyglutarate dehydrogenase, mitochondrial n=1 Tax=Bursaphelenchus okinawaensis TaxID=465554 RepID=A0A811LA75_9BILA|nr:unnamed protein product [Bursaphelenchus okinawaensis]CAG9119526.1 unnamed protein product [Bursaphelenchus okinawaensis]